MKVLGSAKATDSLKLASQRLTSLRDNRVLRSSTRGTRCMARNQGCLVRRSFTAPSRTCQEAPTAAQSFNDDLEYPTIKD